MQIKAIIFSLCIISLSLACKKSETVIKPTDFALNSIASLPPVLTESSGLAIDAAQNIYSINDKGGEDELYVLNQTGGTHPHTYLQQCE